jgi:hypothetical protein
MYRFLRSPAAAGIFLLGLLIAASAAAQSVDPSIAGRWQGSTGALTGNIVFNGNAQLAGTVSETPLSAPLAHCLLQGYVPADNVQINSPTQFYGSAIVQLTGCNAAARNHVYFVLVNATPTQMNLDFVADAFGRVDFSLKGMSRTQLAASLSRIADARIPGHWHGTQGAWSATIDLDARGAFSGTVSGPDIVNCSIGGSITTASTNVQGSFQGEGDVSMSGCFRDWVYSARLIATPERLTLSIYDMQACCDQGQLVYVEGMARTASLGASADAREAKAGMWNSPLGSGWGLSVVIGKTAQRTPFVVLHVYGSNNVPTWYVMSSGVWKDDANFEGELYATTGSDWRSLGFDPRSVTVKKVGTLLMTFTSDSVGRLTYQIDEDNATYVSSSPMVKQEF